MKSGYYISKQDKLLKKFDKISVFIEKKLVKYYDEKFANEITKEAHAEFENIIPEIPYFPGRINIFREVMVINAWMISFYKPMKKFGKTVEETMKIFYEVTEEFHISIPKILRWLLRKLIFSPIFFKIVQISSKNVFDHPDGWKIEYKKEGKDCDWYFEATECGAVKFLSNQGVPELASYCNFADYIQSNLLGLGMQQLSCIGAGDKNCIECMKQGRRTELPSNLKKLFENKPSNENSK
ncbi:MAG: L-2-amino-thiazoline-4-carboxylic acid hydrolase [Candidatus Methanofastidiosia archaeon]